MYFENNKGCFFMLRYFFKKLLVLIFMILGVMLLIFFLICLIFGDLVEVMVGECMFDLELYVVVFKCLGLD